MAASEVDASGVGDSSNATPDGMSDLDLPDGAEWASDGFSRVVVPYTHVAGSADPNAFLQDLWTLLLEAGRASMLDRNIHADSPSKRHR